MNSVYDLHSRLTQCLQSLLGSNHDGLRESGYQVTATYFHGQYFRSAVCGTDVDLDFLCGSLTDQQVVLLSHIADQRLIKIITRNLDGGAYYGSAQGDDCDIRSTASDIYDHVSACLGNIDSSTDRCGNRLLDDADLAGTCLVSCVLNSLSLNLCRTARDADSDTRFS